MLPDTEGAPHHAVTTRAQMARLHAGQAEIVVALCAAGADDVAGRLERCAAARRGRRSDSGWPWTCRGVSCAWCGPALLRRWWAGMLRWAADAGEEASVAVLPLRPRAGGLRAAVAALRRSCRDVRDRMARRRRLWRAVCMAGMAAGGEAAVLLVAHPGVPREEVGVVLRRRWARAVVVDPVGVSPSWALPVADAVELGRVRRGAEPLRILVLPQRDRGVMSMDVALDPRRGGSLCPMPCVL